MTKVKNIEIEKYEFGDVAAKLQSAYKFLKFDQSDRERIQALLPTATHRLSFEVVTNTALANGFRRIMLDEIEWPRLTCKLDDIRTDDAYVARLTDYLQNRVQLIPTGALASGESKYHIDIKNETQETIIIKSRDIKHESGEKIEFDKQIDLCNLMPGRALKVPIVVEWGTNHSHASFSNFHGVTFRPLTVNAKPLDADKLPPSYEVHPDSYQLGFTCEAMISPRAAAAAGWRTFKEKLERAAKNIDEFGNKTMPYITDTFTVTQIRGGAIRYEFRGETLTITNAITWYAYQADPSITYLQAGDDHPEDPSSLIRIVHKDHARLLANAARAAAADCAEIMKAFVK